MSFYADTVSSIYSLVDVAFTAQYPAIPLVLENQPFNWGDPPDKFVTLTIKFYEGSQIGIASAPKTRIGGFVYATLYAREGTGTLAGLDVLYFLAGLLAYKSPGAVRLQAARLDDTNPAVGWHTDDISVPFHADEI